MLQSGTSRSAGPQGPGPLPASAAKTTGRRLTLYAALLALAAHHGACDGCHGNGCAGCAGQEARYPDPPPAGGAVQTDVARIRLTRAALDLLGSRLGTLAAAALPVERRDGSDRLVIFLGEDLLPPGGLVSIRGGSDPDSDPTRPSELSLDLSTLDGNTQLSWLAPDDAGRPGVRLRIEQVDLHLDLVMGVQLGGILPEAACRVQDRDGQSAVQLDSLGFDLRLDVEPTEDGTTRITGAVQNLAFNLGDTSEAAIVGMRVTPCDGTGPEPVCADALCASPGSSCAAVCGLGDLFSRLGGLFNTVVEPFLDALAPTLGTMLADVLVGTLADLPLSQQSELDMSDLLGPAFSGAHPLYLRTQASEGLTIRGEGPGTGLDLGLDVGFAAQPHPCAIAGLPPDLLPLAGPPPNFSGFVEIQDRSGQSHFEAYHIAVSASQAALTQLGWQLYRSGLFCLELDSSDIAQLVGGSFSLDAGLLMSFDGHLAGLAEPDAPVMLSLHAGRQPSLRLGSGRPSSDGTREPTLWIRFDNLAIGFYMLIDDAWFQLSSVNTDVVIELAALRTPDQSVGLVLQQIATLRVEQTYNELAPNADVPALVRTVIDVALGAILGDDPQLPLNVSDALSAALGVPVQLRLNTIRRDLGPTGIPHLSVYATLCREQDLADPTRPPCYEGTPPVSARRSTDGDREAPFTVRLVDEASLYVEADRARFPAPRWLAAPSGSADLRVGSAPDGALADDADYEYQTRVDGGLWGPFRPAPAGHLRVQSPRLLGVGKHEIQVRRQVQNQPMTRSGTERLSVWVDRVRPTLTVTRAGGTLHAHARDLGTAAADLQLWARWHDASGPQPWWPTGSIVNLSEHGHAEADGHEAVELVARDLAGNSSEPVLIALSSEDRANPAAASTPPAALGCAATHGGRTTALLATTLLLGIVLRRRRG